METKATIVTPALPDTEQRPGTVTMHQHLSVSSDAFVAVPNEAVNTANRPSTSSR